MTLAFSSKSIPFLVVYGVLVCLYTILWYLLWKGARVEDKNGNVYPYSSFLKWALWEQGGLSVYANWIFVIYLIFNIVRGIATIAAAIS